jgi:hypothetical protein
MSNRVLRSIGLVVLAIVLIGATFKVARSRVEVSVVDALGRSIGTAVGFAMNASNTFLVPIVALSIDNKLVLIAMDQNRFRGTSPANIAYFQSTDCSGTPFFNVTELSQVQALGPGPYTFVSGNRVSFLDASSAPHHFGVEMHSAIDSDSVFGGESGGVCGVGTSTLAEALEGEFLGDLDELFVPPFSMR